MYCSFKHITLHKGFVESDAWNRLLRSPATIKVLIYIWSCLKWTKIKSKGRKKWQVTNNGIIEISTVKMRDKLGLSKATVSKAIHLLIEVGVITLTRVGENKLCHMYKILYSVVPEREERWRRYPEQNWKHECPKHPNNLVGKNTRFKSHPTKVNRISDNQSNGVYLTIDNSKVD